MRKKPEVLQILKAEYVIGHTLKLLFSDGDERTIDFKPFLENSNHPDIRKYLSQKAFTKFTLKNGDLMWGDFDLIFPIMDLYKNQIDKPALERTFFKKASHR